jgi:hypothetical protein
VDRATATPSSNRPAHGTGALSTQSGYFPFSNPKYVPGTRTIPLNGMVQGYLDSSTEVMRTSADELRKPTVRGSTKAVNMATSTVNMAAPHQIVPLHLAGNMTEQQRKLLQEMLSEAAQDAYQTAIEQLDKQSARTVLETEEKLKSEIAQLVVDTIHRHTATDKFKDEEVGSDRVYPSTYRVRPIEAQVTELKKLFPGLGSCQEKLARRQLPEGAEAWFAIPRWQALASTYNQAVEMVLGILASKRRFSNRVVGRLSDTYLRQSERSKLAETILADQQQGNDILVVAAQAGMLHRGCSARRTRVSMAGNEFGMGIFSVVSMLLTHPERLSDSETLMIDCGGDEYSVRGDHTFDRVPLFDFDMSGIEFSIFYEDRARNLWGTPTGFLYKLV